MERERKKLLSPSRARASDNGRHFWLLSGDVCNEFAALVSLHLFMKIVVKRY